MPPTWHCCSECQTFFLRPEDSPPSSLCPACSKYRPAPVEASVAAEYHYIEDRRKVGPVSLARLKELVTAGRLRAADMILPLGTTKWTKAAELSGLFPSVASETSPAALPHDRSSTESPAVAVPALPPSDCREWYYRDDNNETVGPVGFAYLRNLVATGWLRRGYMLLPKGSQKWVPALTVESLFSEDVTPVALPSPPPVKAATSAPVVPVAVEKPEWYYIEDRRRIGPVDQQRIEELLRSGELRGTDMLLPNGTDKWSVLRSIPEFAALAELVTPSSSPPLVRVSAVEPPPVTSTPNEPSQPVAVVAESAASEIMPAIVPESPPVDEPQTTVAVEPEPAPPVAIPQPAHTHQAVPIPGVVLKVEPLRPDPASVEQRAVVAATAAPSQPDLTPEQFVQRFKAAWWQGKHPDLDDYLPNRPEVRGRVLPEMARIDFKGRLHSREAVKPETYLERYPELADNSPATLDLIDLEYQHRRRGESNVTAEEYFQRFPSHRAELSARWQPSATGNEAIGPASPSVEKLATPGLGTGETYPTIPEHEILGVSSESEGRITYKARFTRLNQPVALLLLPSENNRNGQFQQEAAALAALYHPNIRKLYESGEVNGKRFLSLELIDAEPLARRLGAPQPTGAAAELIEKLADALHHAHGRGVVHGQLCPESVWLQTEGSQPLGVPKLADFAPLRRTAPPVYAPPERDRIENGPRTDIYALGAILYEMLTGRPPFLGETAEELRQQVQSHPPAPPSHIRPSIPAELDTICLQCLEKEPNRRYSSAGELARDLRLFLAGKPVEPAPLGLYRRAARFARREPVIAGIVAGLLLFLFLMLVVEHLKYARATQAKAHMESAVAQAEDRARQAKQAAEQANQAKATAENEKTVARTAQEAALAELAKSRKAEQTGRENELKAMEREKSARESADKARADEKKALEEAIQARAALAQSSLAWHRQHAEQWEKVGQWTAAAYHLGKLIDAAPKDETLLVRRADAYRQAGDYLAAVSDYSRALELKPNLPLAAVRERCLQRSVPAQAGCMIGLGATGVLGGPIGLPGFSENTWR